MDEMTLLAGLIGFALLVVTIAIVWLVGAGRVVPFPTSPAAWWAGRR